MHVLGHSYPVNGAIIGHGKAGYLQMFQTLGTKKHIGSSSQRAGEIVFLNKMISNVHPLQQVSFTHTYHSLIYLTSNDSEIISITLDYPLPERIDFQ